MSPVPQNKVDDDVYAALVTAGGAEPLHRIVWFVRCTYRAITLPQVKQSLAVLCELGHARSTADGFEITAAGVAPANEAIARLAGA